MKSYLVTGGAGFVGASLVRALVTAGHQVSVLDSGVAAGFAYLARVPARIVAADMRDQAALEAAVRGCDGVIHLAAQTSVGASLEAPLEDGEVNVAASLRLLEASRAAGVARFVFASSNAVTAGHPPPASEALPPRPVVPYGAAKAAMEAYLAAFHAAHGMETVALRFANCYGPWSSHKTSVVASFARRALAGEPLVVYGDGRQTRDLVHVDDIVRLVETCLEAPAELVAGEVFQAGSGRETSVLELAEMVQQCAGSRLPVSHLPPRAGDVARNYSDVGKAQRVLDFTAAVPLGDGVARTVEWFSRST